MFEQLGVLVESIDALKVDTANFSKQFGKYTVYVTIEKNEDEEDE